VPAATANVKTRRGGFRRLWPGCYDAAMRHALQIHRDFASRAATRIEVAVTRPHPAQLGLRYQVSGEIERLRLPEPAELERADELWKATCFEAFLLAPDGPYVELNFAPSLRWAAYRFDGYRAGMRNAEDVQPPWGMEARSNPAEFTFDIDMDLPILTEASGWKLALSAVIEETDGGKSYWALAHPPGKPDFHHPDSFVLDLPETA
jgi:hypothetical protein